ncbi:MAG: PAS domain S-box protein [Planctomycetales bacterium]|nr:PAS domain S-box protein [Planctomycetales bacterium]
MKTVDDDQGRIPVIPVQLVWIIVWAHKQVGSDLLGIVRRLPNRDSVVVFLVDVECAVSDLATDDGWTVETAEAGRAITPTHLYVLSKDTTLTVRDGVFCSQEHRPSNRHSSAWFSEALLDPQTQVVGVTLGDVGGDQVVGIRAIRDAGGLTVAENSTSFQESLAAALVDHIASFAEIPGLLASYVEYFFGAEVNRQDQADSIRDAIPDVADILKENSGHDFRHYKTSTLVRRIRRRMQVRRCVDMETYLRELHADDTERNRLFRDLLIGVTSFFRDADAFESLVRHVLSELFAPDRSEPVRIWVPGCATGEEAYSLAMLCDEQRRACGCSCEIQIFATDIDAKALHVARQGVYSNAVADVVTRDRLERYFFKRSGRYHVQKEIRELCLFSLHNLINDPPFSKLDLISCRNLLIYLGPHLQKKLIPLFHYALRPGGYLFLGPSENLVSHRELFRDVDVKHRISQRRRVADSTVVMSASGWTADGAVNIGSEQSKIDLNQLGQRIILDEFSPEWVIVDEDGQIHALSERASEFLQLIGGRFQNSIVKLTKQGLRSGVRTALREAIKQRRRVEHDDLSLPENDQVQRVRLTIQPMPRLGEESGLFMVVFQRLGFRLHGEDLGDQVSSENAESLIQQLERELQAAREDLDRSVQDLEATNEELKSSNEELLSMNEELQSANEELEASKEEVHSANLALREAKVDLENLIDSTGIATLFLDQQWNVKSFTPAACQIYNLIPTDVGRPIWHITHQAVEMPAYPELDQLPNVAKVIIQTHDGRFFDRRIHPYLSDSSTQGMVVTFTEVTEVRENEQRFRATFENAAVGIAHVGLDGSWNHINDRLCEILGYERSELMQLTFQDVTHSEDLERDLNLVRQIMDGECEKYSMEKRYVRKNGEIVWVNLTVSLVRDTNRNPLYFISVVQDISERRRAEQRLLESEGRLRSAMEIAGMGMMTVDYQAGTATPDTIAASQFGLVADEPVDRSVVHTRFHPDERSDLMRDIELLLSNHSEGTINLQHRVIRPDGGVRWLRVHKEIDFCPQTGAPLRALVASIDVTDQKESERQLRESEYFNRTVLENSPDCFHVMDVDGTLRMMNESGCSLMEIDDFDQIQGRPWRTLWPKESQSHIDHAIHAAQDGDTAQFQAYCPTAMGTPKWWDVVVAPVLDVNKQVRQIVAIARDITEARMAEQALQESADRFRAAIEVARLGTIVIDYESDTATPDTMAAELFGLEANKPVSRSFIHRRFHPADQETISALIEGSLAMHEDTAFSSEQRVVLPDGGMRWLNIRKRVQVDPETGQPVRGLMAVVDVTHQKEAERSLLQNEARLRHTLNAAQAGTWDWYLNTGEMIWSQETYNLFGLEPDADAAAPKWRDRVHPDDRAKVDESILESLRERQSEWNMEFRILHPEKGIRWLMGLGRIEYSKAGTPIRMAGINLDITDRKDFESSLERARKVAEAASRSRGEFLANMSHEIRTPMTAILGHADILSSHIKDPDNLQTVDTIRRNGRYLLEIINDILDLSKIDAGKLEIERERVRPDILLNDIRSLMDVRAQEKNLPLTFEVQGQLPVVIETDAVRLRQILLNLIGNAIKFTDEGSVQVLVQYEGGSNQMRFDISDTGIGISEFDFARLFQPFSQADTSNTRAFGGTGLGLAISRRLAKALGGDISVKSQLGVGSTFSVSVNCGSISDVQLVHSNLELEKVDKELSLETRIDGCVLIVDDRRDIRYLAQHFVEKAGGTVLNACHGQEAVDIIAQRTHEIDLVLMDMQMPVMDGYQATSLLRKSGFDKPIIALTANAMKEDRDKCLAAGCNDYTTKPLRGADLVHVVADNIRKYRTGKNES